MIQDQEIWDPRDVDREEFNVDLYMLDIKENCNLQLIMTRKNTLDSEIAELNSDIQNMVYENYTKFIGASQVVSNITANFGKMMEDMHLLLSKMYQLESTSTRILDNLQPSKDGIVKWSKSHESARKLISLIDLVPKLKKLVEGGDYVTAAHYYLKARHVLQQNRHLKSLKGIIKDSDDIVLTIKLCIKENLNCTVNESEEIIEAIKLLLELGEESETVLKELFLVTAKKLSNTLQVIEKNTEVKLVNADQTQKSSQLKLMENSRLSCSYLDALSKVINIVQRLSMKMNVSKANVLENFVLLHTEALLDRMRQSFKDNFNEIADELFSTTLDQLYRKYHDCYTTFPKIALSARDVEFLLYVCNDRSNFHLCRMKDLFDAHLRSLKEGLSLKLTRLDDALDLLDTAVEDILLSTLSSLCHYIQPENKYSRNACFRKQFCKVIVREGIFISFIKYMNDVTLRRYSTMETKEKVVPSLYALLAKFTFQMAKYKVHDFLSEVNEKLLSSEENLKITSIPDVCKDCSVTAQRVLQFYVQVRHMKMSSMLKNSFENKNWTSLKEPWKVSAVIRRVIEDFDGALHEIEPLFGLFSNRMRSRDSDLERTVSFNAFSRTSSPERNSMDGIITNRIYQLFSRPPVYSATVEFTSDSILGCIVKMTLKSLLECVRQSTFNQYGLQQMQVDVYCLEVWVLRYLENGQDFILMFDDIISSCYNRTIQPEFMNHRVVSAICQTF